MKGLVIDASPAFRLELVSAFRKAGLGLPIFAGSIPETLRLFDGSVDFIVTDGNSSHVRAVGLTRRLRATEETATVPIILVTTQRGQAELTAATAAGVTRAVLKPFSPATLAAKIDEAVASAEDSLNQLPH